MLYDTTVSGVMSVARAGPGSGRRRRVVPGRRADRRLGRETWQVRRDLTSAGRVRRPGFIKVKRVEKCALAQVQARRVVVNAAERGQK